MSPITKLFVVLHVVLSMLLTAGVVVFVNRVDQYNLINAKLTSQVSALTASASAAQSSEQAAKDALNAANIQLASQIQQAQTDRNNAAQQLADANMQLAEKSKELVIAQADNIKMVDGMRASQTAQTQLATQVADLRNTVDKLTKDKADLDSAVADLTNQRDVLEKQRRDLAEKNVSLGNQLEVSNKTLTLNGLKPNPSAVPLEAPPIDGVVREVRTIAQIPYATISVGSADAVTKGMEFKVVDRNSGDFLGKLIVESVEPNEATGRLQGPSIGRIVPGVEVKTQL